jgi:hypothetical protein
MASRGKVLEQHLYYVYFLSFVVGSLALEKMGDMGMPRWLGR